MMELIEVKKYAAASALHPEQASSWLGSLPSETRTAAQRWLEYYGSPYLARKLARNSHARVEHAELPVGSRCLFFKYPQPGESQMRLTYASVIEEFVKFLEITDKTVVESESGGHVMLWFPGSVPDDPERWLRERWQELLTNLTSPEGFGRTFALALNSAKLAAGAGFATLETPIFNRAHALSIAGFYWVGLDKGISVNKRDFREVLELEKDAQDSNNSDKKRAKAVKDAETKRAKAQKFREDALKYLQADMEKAADSQTAKVLGEVLKLISDDLNKLPKQLTDMNPEAYRQIRRAAQSYSATAREQLNAARGDIFRKIVWELVRLAEGEYEEYRLPALLSTRPFISGRRAAGDAHGRFCYSCGKPSLKDETMYLSRRLMFEAPEQRPQSAGSSGPVKICAICAGLSLLGPIKISPEALVIRIGGRETLVAEQVRQVLERQVLSELGTVAGTYLNLRATESDKKGNPAPDVWGRRQYGTAKLALTLRPEVFARQVEIYLYDKGREMQLSSASLYFTAALARAYKQDIRQGSDLNRHLGRAVRYFDSGKWMFGEYELLRGFVSKPFTKSDLYTSRREAEEARGQLVQLLEESMKEQDKAAGQKYRDIIGYATLLSAFTERAMRDMSHLDREDSDRELRKLILLARNEDDPAMLAKRALAWTKTEDKTKYGFEDASLFANQLHPYSYKWAKQLLNDTDRREGVQGFEREKQGVDKNGQPYTFLSIHQADIAGVSAFLHQERYKSQADWREFLYEAHLSLFAHYPRLLKTDAGKAKGRE